MTRTPTNGAGQLYVGLGALALAMFAWLAAIALEASIPGAATWSVPWTVAYALGLGSGLFAGWTARRGLNRWLGYGSALVIVVGAAIRTLVEARDPSLVGALTAVDAPFVVGLGLSAIGLIRRSAPQRSGYATDTSFALGVGLLIVWLLTLLTEYVARPNLWHGSEFYVVTALVTPGLLAFAAAGSPGSWTATKAAACYMAIVLLAMWGFQSVPLTYQGSGIHQNAHLLPPPFPLVLVVPALFMDVVVRYLREDRGEWLQRAAVVTSGAVFLAVMVFVHWPLADFLLSPTARNAVFAADQWPFYADIGDWRYEYWTLDAGKRRLVVGLALASVLSSCSVGIGSCFGRSASAE